VNFCSITTAIDSDDQTALRMLPLPVAVGKPSETLLYARVKLIAKLLDAILFPARSRAAHSLSRRNTQHNRKIGDETAGCESVRLPNFRLGQPASVYLVSVGREKKPVHQYNYTIVQRRVNLIVHELRARCHEEKGFGAGSGVLRGVQEQSTNGISQRGASGLAQGENLIAFRFEPVRKKLQLRRLARAF
jgi:hypothetical protein